MRHIVSLFAFLVLAAASLPQAAHAVASPWLHAVKQGNTAYFLHAAAPRIERFDLANNQWSTAIALEKTPTAFHVDDTYLYIAYGKSLYRYLLDGSSETHIGNFLHNVISLHTDGDLLFVNHSSGDGYIDSYNRNTRQKLDSETVSYPFSSKTTISTSRNVLQSIYSSYITSLSYNTDGTFGTYTSPYNYNGYFGSHIFEWPNSNRFVTQRGYVYQTSNNTELTQLSGDIADVVFLSDTLPIVATGNDIIAFSRAYQETGKTSLDIPASSLFLQGNTIHAFWVDNSETNGMGHIDLEPEDLDADDPNAPIDPAKLAFEPDNVFADANGTLFLTANYLGTLFRWDTETQTWLSNIELQDIPTHVEYAPGLDRILVGYYDGQINAIDPSTATPVESNFAATGLNPLTRILPAGDLVLAQGIASNNYEFQSYDSTGTLLDTTNISYNYDTIWNESSRNVVFARGYGAYNLTVAPDGSFSSLSSRYLSNIDLSAPHFSHPNESTVLASNGVLFDPSGQQNTGVIPESLIDALWINDTPFTLHENAVKTWTLPTYAEGAVLPLANEANAIAKSGDVFALITILPNGFPRITVLDESLTIVAPDTLSTPTLSLAKKLSASTALSWTPVNGALQYHLERSTDSGTTWSEIAAADFDINTFADLGFTPETTYQYRVKASNGDLHSAYSNTLDVDTSSAPSSLTPIAPSSITATPRKSFVDHRNILYITFDNVASVIRYDLTAQTWLESIPTHSAPSATALSSQRDSLFIGYSDGSVYEVNLKSENLTEVPFAQITRYVSAIVPTDDFIVVVDSYNHHVFDHSAQNRYSSSNYNDIYDTTVVHWDSDNQTYYWYDYRYLYQSTLAPDGSITTTSNYTNDSSTLAAFEPESGLYLLQNGNIHTFSSNEAVNTLASSLEAATWIGDILFTVSDSSISSWVEPTYSQSDTFSEISNIRSINKTTDNKLAVLSSQYNSPPNVDILSTDLEIVAPTQLATPSTPTLLEPNENQIQIRWNDIGGETSYAIERRSSEGTWTEIGTTQANQTSFTDSDITQGSQYEYRIKAVNGDLASSYSESLDISGDAPTPVSDFAVVLNENDDVELSWTPSPTGILYRIERSAGNTYFNTLSGNLPPSTTAFLDTDFYNGTLYLYRIISYNAYGETASSPVVEIYKTLQIPSKPYDLYAYLYNDSRIQLSWSETYNTSNYKLERKANDGEWTLLATPENTIHNYPDFTISPGTTYTYRVSAVNPVGSSQYTVSESITTPEAPIPSAPGLAVGQDTNTSVHIAWSPQSNIDTYTLLRRSPTDSDWTTIGEFSNQETEYRDTDLANGDVFTYAILASNEVGTSSIIDTHDVTIQTLNPLLEVDFETGYDSSIFEYPGSDKIVQSNIEGIGKYLDFEYYARYLSTRSYDASNGAVFSFSLSFIGSEETYHENAFSVRYRRYGNEIEIARIKVGPSLVNKWRTFHFTLPPDAYSDSINFIFHHSDYQNYGQRFAIDNVTVSSLVPNIPSAPEAAIATTTAQGKVAVLWTPSKNATSYRVERTIDDGITWTDVFETSNKVTYWIEPGSIDSDVAYRVFAINIAGESEPTLSNTSASDLPVATIAQLAQNEILESPNTWGLYTLSDLSNYRSLGREDVQNNPELYGLFLQETISNLYFRLTQEPIEIEGDLLSIPWILYRSANMVNWTEHPFTFQIDLEEENAELPVLMKIGPDTSGEEN